jgi:hypothetical protein
MKKDRHMGVNGRSRILQRLARVWVGAALVISTACSGAVDEHFSKGTDMSDLFNGADASTIGNTATAVPAQAPGVAPSGWGPQVTVVKFQPGLGAISRGGLVDKMEGDPHVVSVSIYATPVTPGTLPIGPITGIALWATGAGSTQIAEFDIPVATDQNPAVVPPIGPKGGGTLISVVATSLEIRARNDANLVPQSQGVGQINNPLGNPGSLVLPVANNALVTASLGAGVKSNDLRTTKTVWLINSSGGAGFAANSGSIFAPIPPFAASFRVLRGSQFEPGATVASAIQVALADRSGGVVDGFYNVGAGVVCPEIPLSGQAAGVLVTNNGAFMLDTVAVIFYLAV